MTQTDATVKLTKRPVCCSISGEVRQGGMMALMGPSGCGKSSLLNVLSSRFGGMVSGDVNFNGRPLSRGMKRRLGYVLQEDILASQLTVRETLQYTARLRLPSAEMSVDDKLEQ
jgi:ATP-binding cassette, subfamily G (WHITE), member 2, SNQ2